MSPALRLTSLSLGCFLAACSSATGRPIKQADGGYQLSCKGPLTSCLRHAERLCRDTGYAVATARDAHEVLGDPAGQSQVTVQSSSATIYCGDSGLPRARPAIPLKRAVPVESSAPPAAPASAATLTTRPRACVPGSTQACVGPGGCSGGQACASDGARFEACDCGPPLASP